ncbi:pilus assembly protein TadG-related protein [Limibaculum sp. FT325]|uniref:pilus assembly protein TadG-related protein n=1 Tax=Thermohalobaculum sediminis TaxID=2939436 RepID=UPI0020C15C50|nr:pilus assembly protein TadG-related protein [Limibaculum sediminis]MCL5777123.1 pilus assembly protein TadG-related protein [Limibaculum sediminis]
MLSTRSFLRDQDGAVTIWLLMWSILFIGFAGLAVDVSNAYRTRAMLQATADAAAHAGAIKLAGGGTEAEVDAEAISYAQTNLPVARNGTVVLPDDVTLVTYIPDPNNPGKGQAYTAMPDKNAVRVIAQRATVEGELTKVPLPTSLLRIIDFNSWNITVEAIAAQGGGMCSGKSNWMIALNDVQFTSGNEFGGDLCVYGKNGIDGNMNNLAADGVVFGWGDEDDPDVYGWSVMECTNCSQRGQLEIPETEQSALIGLIDYMVYDTRDDVIAVLADNMIPAAQKFSLTKAKGGGGKDSAEEQMGQALAKGAKYFHIACNTSNVSVDLGQMVAAAAQYATDNGLPAVTGLKNVTIYTGRSSPGANAEGEACELVGSNINFEAVTIASTNPKGGSIVDPGNSASASTDNVSVKLNGQPFVNGGCVDDVTTWESGLNIFSLGGVNFTAQGDFSTLRIYAMKNVNFTAGPSTTGALDIRTKEGISFTAGAVFDPSCPAADTTIPYDIQRVRLVL